MFQSGVAFGERVYLAHPHGTTATIDVPVLLPGAGPSTRDRAVSATPAGRGDTAGPGRRNRRSTDTSRSKATLRSTRGRTSTSGADPTTSTRPILPGGPDPTLTAARTALGVTAGPVPVDVDLALSRCVTTGETRWASEVLAISDWRRAVTTLPVGPDLAAALPARPDGLDTRPGLRPWPGDGVHWAAAIRRAKPHADRPQHRHPQHRHRHRHRHRRCQRIPPQLPRPHMPQNNHLLT
ncbi:MAG TPA: hypothetical protein VES60_10325 [Nakamurella sp.]|nr:hypothetical protein [Nakamurella sp.]